jgi:hypothetical protein
MSNAEWGVGNAECFVRSAPNHGPIPNCGWWLGVTSDGFHIPNDGSLFVCFQKTRMRGRKSLC